MTRFKVLCGVALLPGLLLVGGSIVANTAQATSTPPKNPQPNVHTTFQMDQTYIPGVPAIHVHTLSRVTANNAPNPAFTKSDVVAFLNKKGFYAGPVVQGAHLKILSIQFVTARQASALMKGESVGRPDDYLVCYVKVQGPFQVQNAEVPPGARLPNADIGDVVFDAHTGNMLVWGVY